MIQSWPQVAGNFEELKAWLERVTAGDLTRLQTDQEQDYVTGSRIRKDRIETAISTAHKARSNGLAESLYPHTVRQDSCAPLRLTLG